MSFITEGKAALKKIISVVEEIDNLNIDSMPRIKEYSQNLLEMIGDFENTRLNNLKKIETNTEEINSLKNKISQNNRDIANLEEKNQELMKNRDNLLNRIQEKQKEIVDTQDQIKAKKEELEARTQRLEELEARITELNQLQTEIEEKLKKLEEDLKEEYEKKNTYLRTFKNRVEAIKSLIRKDYIRSDQLKVIKSLQVDAALDIKGISSATGIPIDRVKLILSQMVQANGPIEYDPKAGVVTLKEEVDF